MTYGIFAIRDKVAEEFRSINLDVNEATAKRNFSYAVNNTPELQFAAKDYELYLIGDFQSDKGVVTAMTPTVLIARGDEVLND